MDYYKSFEVRALNIYIGFMIRMVKLWDYLCFVWKKVILRQSDYNKDHKFPFAIEDLDEEVQKKLQEDFEGSKGGLVQVGTDKWILPAAFRHRAQDVYNMPTRKTDIWVVSYPRSGTTWTQEMVWLIANNLDYKKAQLRPLTRRSPFLDLNWFLSEEMEDEIKEEIKDIPWKKRFLTLIMLPLEHKLKFWIFPRLIKTHLPLKLLPRNINESGAKIVYVARNPKDMLVSYYHLNKLWRFTRYNNNFETFFNYFQQDLLFWSPYWTHVKDAWSKRNLPHVLFIFYEDMQRDLVGTIKKIGTFLDKPIKESDIPKLVEHLSIENFRKNSSVNMCEGQELGILQASSEDGSFIRNGKNGGFTEKFTPELATRADLWIEENLKDTDLRFPL